MNPDLLIAYAHVVGGLGVIREIVIGPRGGTHLDSLRVLTKLINLTCNAACAVQLDHGTRKG